MPSLSAVSIRPSVTTGLRFAARVMTGPLPKEWSPCSFLGIPGVSVAWVTSTAMAASGSSPKAAPRAPKSPISSCTQATATTSAPIFSSSKSNLKASRTTKAPMRLSTEREAMRPFGSSTRSWSMTPTSPTRTMPFASSASLAPMSIQRFFISETFLRSSGSMTWMAFLPITPTIWPLPVSSLMRCPTRTCESQPPTPVKRSRPLSSMWVTMTPISSMCPASMTFGEPPELIVANEFPILSPPTSANFPASSLHTLAAASSYPLGPGVESSRFKKSYDASLMLILSMTKENSWKRPSAPLSGYPKLEYIAPEGTPVPADGPVGNLHPERLRERVGIEAKRPAIFPHDVEARPLELEAPWVRRRVLVTTRLVQAQEQRDPIAEPQKAEVPLQVLEFFARHPFLEPGLALEFAITKLDLLWALGVEQEAGVVHATQASRVRIMVLYLVYPPLLRRQFEMQGIIHK